MQFGIFDHVERRTDVGTAQQYAERLQLIEQAEALGFDRYHVAEHHHSPLCLASDQTAYLAAAAQRTSRIRLSTLVYVLPLHHPIRLIESICTLDQLSNGRFEIGVGRGTDHAQELRMWGGQESENTELFEETLAVLLLGLQNEFVSYAGKIYQYKDLWMELRPVQQPHPPFWWPGNPTHAGERGMNFIGAERTGMDGVRAAITEYRRAYASSATPGLCGRAEPLYGASKHILLADTDEQARERTRLAYESYRKHFIKPVPGGQVDPEEIPLPARIDVDTAMRSGALIYGSPETVRGALREYAAEAGANYFVGSFHWGDLSHAEALRSMELFASEVMPAIEPSSAAR